MAGSLVPLWNDDTSPSSNSTANNSNNNNSRSLSVLSPNGHLVVIVQHGQVHTPPLVFFTGWDSANASDDSKVSDTTAAANAEVRTSASQTSSKRLSVGGVPARLAIVCVQWLPMSLEEEEQMCAGANLPCLLLGFQNGCVGVWTLQTCVSFAPLLIHNATLLDFCIAPTAVGTLTASSTSPDDNNNINNNITTQSKEQGNAGQSGRNNNDKNSTDSVLPLPFASKELEVWTLHSDSVVGNVALHQLVNSYGSDRMMSLRKTHSQQQQQQQSPIGVRLLSLRGVGSDPTRIHATPRHMPSLFDDGQGDAQQQQAFVIVAGAVIPTLSLFVVERSPHRASLTSLTKHVASRLTAAVGGVVSGWASGFGFSSSSSSSSNSGLRGSNKSTNTTDTSTSSGVDGSIEVVHEKVNASLSLSDGRRRVVEMESSPCGQMCAVTDSLGRVSIVVVPTLLVIQIFKGYRGAQCCWQRLRVTAHDRGGGDHSVPCDKNDTINGGDRDISGSNNVVSMRGMRLCLVILAPMRNVVEVWHVPNGHRILALRTRPHSILIRKTNSNDIQTNTMFTPVLLHCPGSGAMLRVRFNSQNNTTTRPFIPVAKPQADTRQRHQQQQQEEKRTSNNNSKRSNSSEPWSANIATNDRSPHHVNKDSDERRRVEDQIESENQSPMSLCALIDQLTNTVLPEVDDVVWTQSVCKRALTKVETILASRAKRAIVCDRGSNGYNSVDSNGCIGGVAAAAVIDPRTHSVARAKVFLLAQYHALLALYRDSKHAKQTNNASSQDAVSVSNKFQLASRFPSAGFHDFVSAFNAINNQNNNNQNNNNNNNNNNNSQVQNMNSNSNIEEVSAIVSSRVQVVEGERHARKEDSEQVVSLLTFAAFCEVSLDPATGAVGGRYTSNCILSVFNSSNDTSDSESARGSSASASAPNTQQQQQQQQFLKLSELFCASLCSTVFASARVHEICVKHLRMSGPTRLRVFMRWWFNQELDILLATPRDSNPIVEWLQLSLAATTASSSSSSPSSSSSTTSSANSTAHVKQHHLIDGRLVQLIVDECCASWLVGHALLLLTLVDNHASRQSSSNVNSGTSRVGETVVDAATSVAVQDALRDLRALCLVWRLLGDGVRQYTHGAHERFIDAEEHARQHTQKRPCALTVDSIRAGTCSLARLVAAQAVAGLTPSLLLLPSTEKNNKNQTKSENGNSVDVVGVVMSRLEGRDGGSTFAAVLQYFSQLQSGLGRDCVLAWVIKQWAEEVEDEITNKKTMNKNRKETRAVTATVTATDAVVDFGVFAPLLREIVDVHLRAVCAEFVWNVRLRSHVASVIKQCHRAATKNKFDFPTTDKTQLRACIDVLDVLLSTTQTLLLQNTSNVSVASSHDADMDGHQAYNEHDQHNKSKHASNSVAVVVSKTTNEGAEEANNNDNNSTKLNNIYCNNNSINTNSENNQSPDVLDDFTRGLLLMTSNDNNNNSSTSTSTSTAGGSSASTSVLCDMHAIQNHMLLCEVADTVSSIHVRGVGFRALFPPACKLVTESALRLPVPSMSSKDAAAQLSARIDAVGLLFAGSTRAAARTASTHATTVYTLAESLSIPADLVRQQHCVALFCHGAHDIDAEEVLAQVQDKTAAIVPALVNVARHRLKVILHGMQQSSKYASWLAVVSAETSAWVRAGEPSSLSFVLKDSKEGKPPPPPSLSGTHAMLLLLEASLGAPTLGGIAGSDGGSALSLDSGAVKAARRQIAEMLSSARALLDRVNRTV